MELKQGAGLSNALVAGGISGSLTRAILSPVDVLKIRFQLQLEPIKVQLVYFESVKSCYN